MTKEHHNETDLLPSGKQEKRLYSYIVACLLESGNLNVNKDGILALAKQAKVSNTRLKQFAANARNEYPEIAKIAKITQWIDKHIKQAGKEPTDEIFEKLINPAEQAGKDEEWLVKQLDYHPSHLVSAPLTKVDKARSLFGLRI